MQLPNVYASGNYKAMMAVPLALVAIALFLALVQPGLERGIELKGGLLVTLQAQGPVDSAGLKAALSKYSRTVEVRTLSTPSGTGVEIELENNAVLEKAEEDLQALVKLDVRLSEAEVQLGAGNATQDSPAVQALRAQIVSDARRIIGEISSRAAAPDDAHSAVQLALDEQSAAKQRHREGIINDVKAVTNSESISFREVGSSLSRRFLAETQKIVLIAFILAAIVVFIVFRSLLPSFAVIFGAAADLIMTMGVMAVLEIPLTLATIATLLMLIGFSLDTDVMMTMRVIKRKEGTALERMNEAVSTGILMNLTTIGAFGALWIVAQWLQIPIYAQIGAVALIGGFADFIATWLFNAPLVLWYMKKQEGKQ